MSDIAASFHQTAGALDPALVRCLDFLDTLPFFVSCKTETWDALRIHDGANILDVACGVGFDVIGMAKKFPQARFDGVDVSPGFLELARKRARGLSNVAFLEANATALPFPDNRFDGARIDRSLQHIPSPGAVIAEMIRVTRAGGRIVLTEPDWGTFVVFNGDPKVGDALATKWRQSFINPYIGRALGLLLAKAGVEEIDCRVFALTVSDFDSADIVFDLRRVLANCVADGSVTPAGHDEWLAAARSASETGGFFSCLSIVSCSGSVSGPAGKDRA